MIGTEHDSEEHIHTEDHVFAGVILLLIGLTGCIANVIGVYTVYKCRHLHNSFGFLCLSHCIANFGVCFTFALWCAPTTIFEVGHHFTSARLGKHIGQFNIFCWDACVYSHLSISINRFICINFPLQSQKFFTKIVIGVFIAVPWTLAVFHVVPYFWVNDCFIFYDPLTWQWNYADTVCGNYISIYFDFYTGLAVFSVMLVTDMGTLLKLKLIHHKAAVFTDLRDHSHRRRQETRFFFQSLCQSAIFGIELICFYFISTLAESQWMIFLSSTFVWVACHAADGLILDLFHTRRAFKVCRRNEASSAPFHTIHDPHHHHQQHHIPHHTDNSY